MNLSSAELKVLRAAVVAAAAAGALAISAPGLASSHAATASTTVSIVHNTTPELLYW